MEQKKERQQAEAVDATEAKTAGEEQAYTPEFAAQEGPSEAALMELYSIAKEQGDGVKRRSFLKWGGIGLVGAGLVVGIAYPQRVELFMRFQQYMSNRHFDPNAFIMIPTKGKVKLVCHRSEMGQGIRTGIVMLLAEELGVSLSDVEIVQGKGDPKYGNQNTDGSRSIRNFYGRLRNAAASARELLREAASLKWSVPTSECRVESGRILHDKTGRSVSFGQVAVGASKLTLRRKPKPKKFREFNIIGKPQKSVDLADFVQGKAKFGADVVVPGMVYACALRAPLPQAKLKSVDATEAKKVSGVTDVIKLEQSKVSGIVNDAVVVIATNTWAAIKGKEALKVKWDTSGCQLQNSDAYKKELEKSLSGKLPKLTVYRNEGDVVAASGTKGGKRISATYHTPFLVHAPMEPMACVAKVTAGGCEIWSPTQDPMRAKKTVAALLGVKQEKVIFNVTYLGGGFGRKSQPDFVLEAVALSKKLNKPVRIQWTREDEIQHGFYHAQSCQILRATLDKSGYPVGWHHRSSFPTIMSSFIPGSKTPGKWELGMGATNIPYQIKNILCEASDTTTPVRIGWLRSVCNVWHCFAVNSFVDELAHAAKADPVAYRYRLLGAPRKIDPISDYPQDTGRLRRVMETTAERFGWEKPLPKGHGKGFANHYSFFSYVAVAIEASCKDGAIQVHRAVITIDCGLAVNPEAVKAQMEGSVIFGLSAAIHGKITLKDGAVEQSNFHDYRLLRMPESPKIEVVIINGDPEKPTGVGEPGVPPIAPALAQALFDATGKRFRDMPFSEQV